MAKVFIEQGGVVIRMAFTVFAMTESCYRNQCQLSAEHELNRPGNKGGPKL